jgi:DNA-binding response OmpR family regulator
VKRILIIKEEADITFSLKQALTDNGFEQVDTFTEPLLAFEELYRSIFSGD